MEKKFVGINELRNGGFILIDDNVCKIVEIEKSKPGKHGAAKARITAIDIFNGQKKQLLKSSDQEAEVPIVEKSDAQVVAIIGNNLQLMDLKTYETFEAPIPEEFKSELTAGREIQYQKFGDKINIVSVKQLQWIIFSIF